MKKSMIFFAVLFVFVLGATEDAVKKTVLFYRNAAADFDVKTALKVCAPEYIEINKASRVDYKQLEKISELMQKLLRSDDIEEMIVIQKQLSGQSVTEQELAQIRAVKGTEHEKTLVKLIKNQLELSKQVAKSLIKDSKFSEVRVEKDKAYATEEIMSPVNKKKMYSDYELVKRDGKWWIIKVVEK